MSGVPDGTKTAPRVVIVFGQHDPSCSGSAGTSPSRLGFDRTLMVRLRFGVCPAGTPDNSPPIHRWVGGQQTPKSPAGAKDILRASFVGQSSSSCFDGVPRCCVSLVHHRCRASLGISFVPTGTLHVVPCRVPPLKRWAIVERPWRDEDRSSHHHRAWTTRSVVFRLGGSLAFPVGF